MFSDIIYLYIIFFENSWYMLVSLFSIQCHQSLVDSVWLCAKMQLYPWFRCLFAMFIMHDALGLSAYNQCIQDQQHVSCSTVLAIMGYTFLSICVYAVLHEAPSYLLLCFTYIQQ